MKIKDNCPISKGYEILSLCSENNWYDDKNSEAYNEMLDGCETDWTAEEVAKDIIKHTSNPDEKLITDKVNEILGCENCVKDSIKDAVSYKGFNISKHVDLHDENKGPAFEITKDGTIVGGANSIKEAKSKIDAFLKSGNKEDLYNHIEDSAEFDNQLLGRLASDCKYYLGAGNRNPKNLWAKNEKEQIAKMRELFDKVHPDWITKEDIDDYEKQMINTVNDSTNDLSKQLEQFVDASKMSAGNNYVDLNNLTDEEYSNVKKYLEENHIEYEESIINKENSNGVKAYDSVNSDSFKDELFDAIIKYGIDKGYNEDEIKDNLIIEIEEKNEKVTHVQIRNEMFKFYENEELIKILDGIVSKYDSESYFEPEDEFVWDAFISNKVKGKDATDEYIYLFANDDVTEEDKKAMAAYKLQVLGINRFKNEVNLAVKGTKENLEKFCKEYFDYDMMRDYLYPANEFAGTIEDSANDMAITRQDAIDRCISQGKVFVEHFKKIYAEPTKEVVNHWANEMQTAYDNVRHLKLKNTNKIIQSNQLFDWFFTLGSGLEIIFKDENEAEVYNKFVEDLLDKDDVKTCINETVLNSIEDSCKDSLLQELEQDTKHVAELYDISVEDLEKLINDFHDTVYSDYGPGEYPNFSGSIIYSEKLWDEFVNWVNKEKNIKLSMEDYEGAEIEYKGYIIQTINGTYVVSDSEEKVLFSSKQSLPIVKSMIDDLIEKENP